MIVATRNAVFLLDKDGSHIKPNQLLSGLEVRRVAEGDKRNVVALTDGDIIILDENEERRLETSINDRIDALCMVREKPLDLLIGTTPPFLYKMNDEGPAKRIKTFDDLEVRGSARAKHSEVY